MGRSHYNSSHAVLDEEATERIQRRLGTGWYVYINPDGTPVLLNDSTGHLEVNEAEGSDPGGADDDNQPLHDEEEPPKKKHSKHPSKSRKHKKGNPDDNGGGQGNEADSDELRDLLPTEKRRGYGQLVRQMRRREVEATEQVGNALAELEPDKADYSGLPENATDITMREAQRFALAPETKKLAKLNQGFIKDRIQRKFTARIISQAIGKPVPAKLIKEIATLSNTPDFEQTYNKLCEAIGSDDARRVIAYFLKLIF